MNFGENLQLLRKMKNYSQEDLAEKLQVSRQAVSKWESGTGFPETEKIIIICEIFNCSMDELVKGKISNDANLDKKIYDSFINKFSKSISLAIMLILMGITLLLFVTGFAKNDIDQERYATYGVVVFLIFVTLGVPIMVVKGIEMSNFKNKYPKLANFYSVDELENFNRTFSKLVALSISIILVGVVVFIGIISLNLFDSESTFPVSIFMLFITIAVPILVNTGIQKDKYDIDKYNRENDVEAKKQDEMIGKYCGIIMIITTIVYLLISFIFNIWEISWIVYPVGGMLCGIVSISLNKN